ncbi:LEAF RUST 10 DISEASE-RESISTANCE LOCUS RECEPTOR-LIKE PROTEIN KINASE-like 1.2 isoform X1 [Oryza brachyantha]|uniref:LEAF RUST 10 DISEASE-RESISTANCE LOCUS RECEPTOR-LIKE PROTEIN KINASE-like 1.2 isoform X1 n=1 Tax=Oryza brachyantha TaxID=4533 RepID=UPI001ADABAC1|nr:LEAF RUST 10 DISEASE-RESISTANCE LOCUS RECEPTOR-LIKE PROTEIN KINASE-like 1.2 isoform X1 [Oryza brachyantha]
MAPLLSFHLLVAFLVVVAGGTYDDSVVCESPTPCGDHVDVKYPFYLANATGAASRCGGYPGLGVICEDDGARRRATLRLGDHNYTVLEINHANHTVTVADSDVLDAGGGGSDCPRVKHNVTLPPVLTFPVTNNDSISFFLDCDFTGAIVQPPDITEINCTGFERAPGAAPSFLAPRPDTPAGEWFRACREVFVAPVIRDWLLSKEYYPTLRDGGYGGVLRRGFQMSWDPTAGQCYVCEQSGGRCSYGGAQNDFQGCLCSDGHVRNLVCGQKISRKRKIIIATSTVAGVLLVLFFVVSFLYIRKRRQYKMSSSSRLLKYTTTSGETPRSRGSSDKFMESGSSSSFHYLQTHHFAYEELEAATDGFSDARELGDGGFGTVYKGELRDGRAVAVKRLYNNSWRRVEQFVNEAAILSRLRHPNLVLFYGCTSSRSRELLLVYEFVPNGTVADHLHGRRAAERALAWPLRLDIAVEAAAALAYLHAVEPVPVVHRDVKTNNILLDANFHVKVADFGLSRLFPRDATHVSTAPQGTPGYVDPEYHRCYQLTDKSDVYSFGVVLVELISSKPAVDVTRDRDEINLAGMAINRIQRSQVDELVDHELGYSSDQPTRKTMTMVAELAFRCLQQNGEMRPPIREVFDVLRGIQEECRAGKGGKRDASPCSPNTVHAPWDSMSTTPNTSQ